MLRHRSQQPIEEAPGAGLASGPPAVDSDSALTGPAGAAPDRATMVAPETRRARATRMAHRTRLHLYAAAAIVLLVYAVALATSNTGKVRVDWVFTHSRVPLVWLVLFAVILGWLLGTLATILFRRRTRAPL